MSTCAEWVAAAGTLRAAVQKEHEILSIGREFLPPCALAVLDGGKRTPEYWDFLISQLSEES